ncbi:MAG: DUF2779 domain-containing protein [Proteobacteria bacterium]|nr:DUF2779 domain-containing protein [Pseudomonadota bacterium]MYJ96139.1 DUF2779 domain-containing protein [Pseudomonadota bacterium]
MTQVPRLSKSRYMSGDQCHLKLWHDTHARELAAEPDDTLKAIFATGHEVGEMACRRYPGGRLVAHDHRHTADALAETRQLLEAGTASALFEPAFIHQGVLVRADVLERLPHSGWRLVEVKSTTRLKHLFVLDTAVQLWVLRGAGLDVREAGVLTLNRHYVYEGAEHDIDALFTLHPVTKEANALLDGIGTNVSAMLAILAQRDAPAIEPGDHCFVPYECPYHAHCTRDFVHPDHGVDELPWLDGGRRSELKARGIEEIRDIPADFPLTHLQRIVRTAVREDRAIVHGDVQHEMARVVPPVRYLDFEAFSPAIPRFAGTRPYDAIPFLFSVHTQGAGTQPDHVDYLHEGDSDPRPRLADRLIEALGHRGSICTYSNYERQVLRSLAAALPDRAQQLRAIEARLLDLLPVVRNGYYHPEFRGSFSIKNVLAVLVPGAGYDDLAITDGQTAAARYQMALANGDPQERNWTFADLRAYCARDTLALARLHEALAVI